LIHLSTLNTMYSKSCQKYPELLKTVKLQTVKNVLTPLALKSLYSTLFHCHLIYAMSMWTICNLQLQKDLHIKQKMAVLTVAGLNYNDHTEPTFKKLEMLPLPWPVLPASRTYTRRCLLTIDSVLGGPFRFTPSIIVGCCCMPRPSVLPSCWTLHTTRRWSLFRQLADPLGRHDRTCPAL
jgi:hypothetical protein